MVKDIHLKVLSVVIAVTLWFVVSTGEYTEMSLYVPVDLGTRKMGFVAVTDTNLVNVVVKGPQTVVKNISSGDVKVSVDVSGMPMGDSQRKIRLDDVIVPAGVEVIKVIPQQLKITVDRFIKKKVQVNPTYIGEPAIGYKVETVLVQPQEVEVEGAKSRLEQMTTVETQPVNLSGRKDPITYRIGLKKVEGIKASDPEQVEVIVQFKEDFKEGMFSHIKIAPRGLNENFIPKVDLPTVKGVAYGRSDNLERLGDQVMFYVETSGIKKPGTYIREVKVVENGPVQIRSFEPKKIRFEIIKR